MAEAADLFLASPQETRKLVLLNLRDVEHAEIKKYGQLVNALSAQVTAEHLPRAILLTNSLRKELCCVQSAACGINTCVENPVNRSQLFNTILEIFGYDAIRARGTALGEGIREGQIKQQLGGSRILVVEDNAINMQVIRELLERVGLVVEEANHGKKALERLQTRHYVAVLMDLQMPEMDGFTATRLIRSDQRFVNLPIIAMTAHAMEEDRQKCLAAGMNGHIGKPFDPMELYDVLARWIEVAPAEPLPKPIASTLSFSDEMPGLQPLEGIARVGGDTALYHRLLLRFRTDHGRETERVTGALQAGNRSRAAHLVHTVKSVAGQLGAARLHQAATGLEKGIVGQKSDEGALLKEFGAAMDELMATLACWLPDSASPTVLSQQEQVVVDWAQVSPLLERLATLLVEQDSLADTLLQPLQEKLAGHPTNKILDEIDKSLKRYDYDAAVDLLVKLNTSVGTMDGE